MAISGVIRIEVPGIYLDEKEAKLVYGCLLIAKERIELYQKKTKEACKIARFNHASLELEEINKAVLIMEAIHGT